jgi:hypothetical protein
MTAVSGMTAVSTGTPAVSAPARGGSGSEPTVCSLIVVSSGDESAPALSSFGIIA